MTDLRPTLQSSLGSAYTLDRELGGGGMSRVFVADEVRLGRKVVVKVLSPELAQGVSIERFEREIRVAAALQHPHIVPVLSAGEAAGLPYYTMPFVEGQSLRARLADGPLPIREVIDVMRAVAHALEYAHGHAVVHRDIKPDNVLLSGRTAVVTDFGIAKALSASRTAGDSETLTQMGSAIGTPAYMSPEQAAGDPTTGPATDFYALGATAYELLTGAAPFSGLPAHKLVWAHMSQEPPPVAAKRPDVLPALAALIQRCLAKDPGARPQSAAEIISALDAITTSPDISATSTRSRSVKTVGASVVALGATLAIAVVMLGKGGGGSTVDDNLVVIPPFRVSADQSLGYLREGIPDLLAANLTGEGGPRAMDPRAAFAAWRRGNGDENPDDAIGIARRAGAGQLVLGSVVGTAAKLVIQAELVAASGRRTTARVEGPADSLTFLIDELTGQLLLQAASTGSISRVPLPAIRAYLEGQKAYRTGRYELAAARYSEARRLDSTFVPATLGAIAALNWAQKDNSELIRGLLRRRDKLAARDRVIIDAWSPLAYGTDPVSMDSSIALWAAAAAALPDNADAIYEKADLLLHFGAFTSISNYRQAAAADLRKALAIDSSFAPALEHLIDIAAAEHDTARVLNLSRQYLALDSLADHATYIRWRAARASGDSARAREIVAGFDTTSLANLIRIAGMAQLDGISIDDARAAAAAIARAPDRSPGLEYVVAFVELNAGRFSGRERELARMVPVQNQRDAGLLGTAAFWDSDTIGVGAAYRRAKQFALSASDPAAALDAHTSACAVVEHAIVTANLAEAAAAATLVEGTRRNLVKHTPLRGPNRVCGLMLSSWLAVERKDPSARIRLDSLADALRIVTGDPGHSRPRSFSPVSGSG